MVDDKLKIAETSLDVTTWDVEVEDKSQKIF